MKVTITFEDEWEFRSYWEESETARKSALVLGELREQLRAEVKHGEPTDRDEYWYDQLWELGRDNDLDVWSA